MPSEMECRELFARLSEFIDGDLDGPECVVFSRHIEDCAPCIAFVDSLRKTVDLSRQLPVPVIPEEFRRHLIEIFGNRATPS